MINQGYVSKERVRKAEGGKGRKGRKEVRRNTEGKGEGKEGGSHC